ncbi:hypothetical protein INT46_009271 [Mucor plumbeus]|uniref:Anaphase-promoting complex subunit 4 n=1 Tax=Mucor plumbeus TaxID=97098 RepID=A0A8H7QIY7_9FUNG|nr:hypothetical protein INT46_009271 [Mucor plumbeus]
MLTEKHSFPLSEEKLLADDVKLISWCPTTDLVLLVSPSNILSLYRSGIKIVRIWSIQHQASTNINVVTWKPNGKEFVLGCDNGIVYKVDITYHSPVISPCWKPSSSSSLLSTEESQPAAPILSLVWINYEFEKKQIDIDGFDSDAFNLESVLPTLSEDPPEEPLSRLIIGKQKKIQLPTKPLKHNEIQTLLFAGDGYGHVQIILNGIYPIGSFALEAKTKINLDAIEISVAHNASLLQIITKSKSNSPEFVSYTLDTQILDDRKEEIHSVSEIQTQLNYLLQYTKSILDVVKRHHDAYSGFTKSIARQASAYITNHNVDTSAMPEVELFATLATGNVTESLQEFFADHLTSQRIKQWESNVKHGYHNSLVIICEHILPACERIQLQLCKLLGYSLWTQRFGDFLKTEAVEECIEKTRKLVSVAFEYSKSLGSLNKNFDAFSKWITTDKNLIYLLSDLSDCCTEMLKRPSETVSTKIQVVSISKVRLNGVSIQAQPRNRITSFTAMENDVQTIYYAVLQNKPETQLMLLKKKFDDSALKYAIYTMNGSITDLEFFDEKELGALIQIDEETTVLQAIPLHDINFQTLTTNKLTISELPNVRSQHLQRMINVKFGCNGLPRRRVLCVVASNGLLKVYFMDESEDSEEEEEEEEKE